MSDRNFDRRSPTRVSTTSAGDMPDLATHRAAVAWHPIDGVAGRVGDASCAGAHSSTLCRPHRATQSSTHNALLRLQRHYGNRYVGRVLDQARDDDSRMGGFDAVERSIDEARGSGQGLDQRTRTQMESSFGADFSSVRVHTDSRADSLNHALNARAFATGRDVFFRQGEYSPGSSSGRELLAHELTHVVQQTGYGLQRRMTVSDPTDPEEVEADQMAQAVIEQEHRIGEAICRQPEAAALGRSAVHGRFAVQRSTLREDSGGDWAASLGMIKSTSDEIFENQILAVNNFCDAVREATPPFEDALMQGVIETLLGAAFGGIGTVMKAAATRFLTRTMVRAELAALGTALNEGEVTTSITATTEQAVDSIIGAGKARITPAVTGAIASSSAAGSSSIARFRAAQTAALIALRGNQERAIFGQLGALRGTPDQHDEWLVANALYAGLLRAKDSAERIQYNKLTDLWFTRQVASIAGGVRPGILRIYLAPRYPDAGSNFSIAGADLSGEGSADAVREQLGRRTLKDIEIPKWITMNGSMGLGILDCDWSMSVHGGTQIDTSGGPVISAALPLAERLVEGDQTVQGYGGNPWGPAWLAAFNLNLHDLDRSDPRNNGENRSAAIRRIWDSIKDRSPGTIGNSSWS